MQLWQHKLRQMTEELFAYTFFTGEREMILPEKTEVSRVLEKALSDYYAVFRGCRIVPEISLPEHTVWRMGNEKALQRVFGNILSNAVKYSDCRKKQPELTISLEQLELEDVLRICDNGVGVKECDFPYIFEKGFTGNPADTGKKATGMGLYLCRKMADDLSLGLEARSQSGKGFEMSIRFPKVE